MKRTLGCFFSVVIMLAVAVPAFSAQGASSKSNKSQVFSYLTQEIGFNTAAACGVMANMEHESGFDSSKVLYDSNGLLSGGLCMWNGGRFSSLKRFSPSFSSLSRFISMSRTPLFIYLSAFTPTACS